MRKVLKIVAVVLFCGVLIASCGRSPEQNTPKTITIGEGENKITLVPEYQFIPPQDGDTVAIVKTSMGDIKIKLFPDKAPKAVENFTTHAIEGYYDNLIFHRVVEDFMIQGGDPLGDGTGGESIWDQPFEDEFTYDLFNYYGSLSMANSAANTNGSQFFIVQRKNLKEEEITGLEQGGYPKEIVNLYKEHGGTPWLNFKHTVFGQVYEGMDVVDEIALTAVDDNTNKPIEDVVIETIEIKEFAKE